MDVIKNRILPASRRLALYGTFLFCLTFTFFTILMFLPMNSLHPTLRPNLTSFLDSKDSSEKTLLSTEDLGILDFELQSQQEWTSPNNSYRLAKSPPNGTSGDMTDLPSCEMLVMGDLKSVEAAGSFHANYTKLFPREDFFLNLALNCSDFRSRLGYVTVETEEERAFPLAFSILAYKDTHQVEQLLRAIYRPSNFYCVHVDAHSSSTMQKSLEAIASCLPGVFLASRLVQVAWGTYSVVEAELICMRDLLARGAWRYFINLTGQEYPLKTNLEIVRILGAMRGANIVDVVRFEPRLKRLWAKAGPAPFGMIPFKGNTHAVLSRGFVTFLLKDDMQPYLQWLKKVVVPDETIFATLNHNPHLKVPGSSLDFPETDVLGKPYLARFKNWHNSWPNKAFHWPCRGKRVRGVCVHGVGDLPLLTSRSELFANKFYWNYQPLTLDCLQWWLLQRVRKQYHGGETVDVSYFENLAARLHVNRPSTDP